MRCSGEMEPARSGTCYDRCGSRNCFPVSQVRKLSRCRLRRSRLRGFIVVSPPSSSSPRRNSHESSAATECRRETEDASRHLHSTISTPVPDALWVGALDPNPVPLIRDQADGGGVPSARRGVPDQAGCAGSAWQVPRQQCMAAGRATLTLSPLL